MPSSIVPRWTLRRAARLARLERAHEETAQKSTSGFMSVHWGEAAINIALR